MSERWLIIGGSGMLGHAFSEYLVKAGHQAIAVTHTHSPGGSNIATLQLDLASDFDAGMILDEAQPDHILYAAGLTNVDQCEANEALAQRLHAEAPAQFAKAAANRAQYVCISTDHLWDGTKALVHEDEPLKPLNAYARTKADGERQVMEANADTLLLRTNFFGKGLPWRKSLSDWMLENLREKTPFTAFDDAYFTPIAIPLLCEVIAEAANSGLKGIYHCCGSERVSKYEYAMRLAEHFSLPNDVIAKGHIADASLTASRPLDMSLSTEKLGAALGRSLPNLDDSFSAIE